MSPKTTYVKPHTTRKPWGAKSSIMNIIPRILEFIVESAFIIQNCIKEYHEITASRHQGQLQHFGSHKRSYRPNPLLLPHLCLQIQSQEQFSPWSHHLSEHCPPLLTLLPHLPPSQTYSQSSTHPTHTALESRSTCYCFTHSIHFFSVKLYTVLFCACDLHFVILLSMI